MVYSEKEKRKAAIEEYLSSHPNAPLREIGKFLGVSRQRAHVLLQGMDLKNVGITMRKKLTAHQLDILRYVAKGHTDRQIADAMGCSAQSIRNQLQAIFAKLNTSKRNDAVQLAIKEGLLSKDRVNRDVIATTSSDH